MDELVQFISASISDMTGADGGLEGERPATTTKPSSSKCSLPDDRATGSTANQISSVSGKQDDSSRDTVQQSQVSSTRSPSVLANDVIGPLLLEALDGFLFMVDHMGKIQFISENVTQYLKYTKDDLIGNNIYNLVHCDDYDHLIKSLDLLSKDSASKSRTFSCRMNIKPPGEERDRCYDNMQITAILQPHPCDVESDKSGRCLLACIARRTGCIEKSSTSLGIEKFTTKQDLKGKILACDTSGGQKSGNHSYSKLIGENVQDFCHINDRQQLLKHHREVISNGSNTSCVYRFRLHESRYVFVQTKSKLFKNPLNGNPEFIMSTHSIIRECDMESELKGSASSCLMKAIIGSSGSRIRDQNEQNALRSAPALAQPQSTIFDLDDFLNDPCLDFDGIVNDSSFSDIPDLLPNSAKCMSLSNISLDKSFTSCPDSPMSSVPSLSPATSVSQSPRSTTTTIQQGWAPKEYRPPKQGRGRRRSSRKSVNEPPFTSWIPSAVGVGIKTIKENNQALPKQNELKCHRMFSNSGAVGNFNCPAVPMLTNYWNSMYSSPSSVEPLPSQFPKKTGFGEISLIQQMCQLQKGNRERSFSGSSGASTSLLDKFPTNLRGGSKNAHLLDLLMRDDDDDEEASSYLCSPPVSSENASVRSAAASVKSEHSDSEIVAGGSSLQSDQAKNDALDGSQTKKPANQNAILKKLLSQADEDSQPFQCELNLAAVDANVNRDKESKVTAVTLADSSATQTIFSVDSSTLNASNEAEPKPTDDALLKQLLDKDDSCVPSRSSSPELLKSLLANDETFARLGEINSSETEVESSGLTSPTPMEVPLPEQLNEFLSSGIKRKALDVDESDDRLRRKHPSRSSSVTEDVGKNRSSQHSSSSSSCGSLIGSSKRNLLLSQLLSKQVENESLISVKDLSAIATVTPLMQMLQQCGGTVAPGNVKVDDVTFMRKQESEDFNGKIEPGETLGSAGSETRSNSLLDSKALLREPKLKREDEEETMRDNLRLQKPSDDDSKWKDFVGFNCISRTSSQINPESTKDNINCNSRSLENLQDDLPKSDIGSPSEEDKKILAELEEVLESSKFTMEDLNSIFMLSSSLSLEPGKGTTKSAINALEEQVSRIDSNLHPQSSTSEGQEPGNANCPAMTNHGWPNVMSMGGEVNELGLLSEFDELMMTTSSHQKYSSQIQGFPQRQSPESSAVANSLYPPNVFDASDVLSSSAQHRDMLHQKPFTQGHLQVNTDLTQRSNLMEQDSEFHSSNREALLVDYTPISPALQDNAFSLNEPFSFDSDLISRSYSTTGNYNLTEMNSPCALGPNQNNISANVVGQCPSGAMTQYGQQFYGGRAPMETRDVKDRKRSGYGERFNLGLNPMMNPSASDAVADHGALFIGSSRRNFDPVNFNSWNQMSTSMTTDQRSAVQFNQSHMNLMNGSHMNLLPKTNAPFYGQAVGQGRQLFKGQVNQMNGNHHLNQMNLCSMTQMNASQVSQMNGNQMNAGQVSQLNFGSIDPLKMGQPNQVGQMNMGQPIQNGQMNMDQPNQIGQMNMGQKSRGNAFIRRKDSSFNEFPNKSDKTCRRTMDAVDRLQSRSNSHRNQADFMTMNQSLGSECFPLRGGQNIYRKMNHLEMNFDSLGMLGYGESGVNEQMPLQSSMNHMGLNSISGQMIHSTGSLRQYVDPMNQVGTNSSQLNHPGQVNHPTHFNRTGQMHIPRHGKSSSSNHGFNRSLDQSRFGPSNFGQSYVDYPTIGQPYMGQTVLIQPGMNTAAVGQPTPVDQPIVDRISQMGGMASSCLGNSSELDMEEYIRCKNTCSSKQLGGGSVRGGGGGGITPSLFGGGDAKMYGYRMSEHCLLQQLQPDAQYSNCTDAMLLSPISNQSSIGMDAGRVTKTPTPNTCGGFPGRSSSSSSARDPGKSLQRNTGEVNHSRDTSTREYIKQELRNMCTARAQGQSLQQQHQLQQQEQQQQQQLHGNQLSPTLSTSFVGDELPLDILESINEITKPQENQKLLEAQKNILGHQTPFNNSAAEAVDPLLLTAENNQDLLGGDQFWEPLSNEELADAQQQALSFEDALFDSPLDSAHVLPKIPVNQMRMMGKSGSILQKLLSDTT